MRAVRLHELGGPERLVCEDVAEPAPGPGETLVRLHAAALNHRDLFITRGLYPNIALPVQLGSDGAGTAGDDEVVIDPMLGWGGDRRVRARGATILGMPHPGTFADAVVVPDENVHPKPPHLTMEEAAALPLGGLTAYRALFTRGGLRTGETVLLPGIGGGVQTFALLFARHAGARAIVTSSSREKLDRAIALGADAGVDYTRDGWEREVKALGPVDLVVDSSGGTTLDKVLPLVRPGGRVVVYGGTHPEAAFRLFPLFWNELDVRGSTMGSPDDFAAMLALVREGRIHPVVDEVFPLEDAVDALRRMDDAAQFGKIVLRISR